MILDWFIKKNIMIRNYPNNFLLQRISGGAFDFMVTASVAGISLAILKEYLVPTLLVTTIGGIVTTIYIVRVCKKYYQSHVLESNAPTGCDGLYRREWRCWARLTGILKHRLPPTSS